MLLNKENEACYQLKSVNKLALSCFYSIFASIFVKDVTNPFKKH